MLLTEGSKFFTLNLGSGSDFDLQQVDSLDIERQEQVLEAYIGSKES